MGTFKTLFRHNIVLVIAFVAALATSFIVPPDRGYTAYFDFRTLACLFCVMAVVCALRNIRFFYTLARKTVTVFHTARLSVLALVSITFIGSMAMANDMALITFLPLGYFVLSATGKEKYMAFTFIMQNIAANLGGMLTPFGNPQNLYLYSKFSIPTLEFMAIMFPPFLISIVLIFASCLLFVKPEPLEVPASEVCLPKWRMIFYIMLFVFSILIVLKGVPYIPGALLILFAVFIADRRALLCVDYSLLLTFVCFFVFSGNMARIEPVRELLTSLLEESALLVSVTSCQVISNVPSAVLLSQFTGNYSDLLLGVNIGGTGTLVASLASLITFKEFTRLYPGRTRQYLVMFTLFSFAFLFILVAACLAF